MVFVDPASHQELLEARPKAYSTNGWSEKYGALNVHLKHINQKQFRSLVFDSWLRKAPKSLANKHRGT